VWRGVEALGVPVVLACRSVNKGKESEPSVGDSASVEERFVACAVEWRHR